MKICTIICELNPLHNGHKYLIERARSLSGCDFTVCVMSGCFTQRGEMCRNDKFVRAAHAVLSGADAVIELPAPFAVAPAEIFARGAVTQLKGLNADLTLAFGCESGCAEDFKEAAYILNAESRLFKRTLADWSELNGKTQDGIDGFGVMSAFAYITLALTALTAIVFVVSKFANVKVLKWALVAVSLLLVISAIVAIATTFSFGGNLSNSDLGQIASGKTAPAAGAWLLTVFGILGGAAGVVGALKK